MGLTHFTGQICVLDFVVVKLKMCSVCVDASLRMPCIISVEQPEQVSYCDETKKLPLNSHIVRAREKTQLNHGGLSHRLGHRLIIYFSVAIESDAVPIKSLFS